MRATPSAADPFPGADRNFRPREAPYLAWFAVHECAMTFVMVEA